MEVAIAAVGAAIVGSAYYSKETADNQKKAIKKSNALAAAQADLDRQSAQMLLEEQQRKNKNLLRQQQSSYKAKLGASGLNHTNGSGQIILDALQKEHDIEDKYLVEQAKISLQSLDNALEQTTRRNLLALDNISANQKKDILDGISSTGRSIIK